MEAEGLRWGILSTARINQALIPPIRLSQRSQLWAVASRSKEKAERYAQEEEIPHAYGSYEELLADQDVNVVYNPLPNSLHAEWTIKAAQAGKNVLCEKPLALSVEEVDAITRAAKEYGVVVAEAFMYRHHPQTWKVKELVSEGAIGKLQLVRGSFSFMLDRVNDVRWDADLGGGSIWDVGCYPISYANYLTGQPPREAFGWQVSGPDGVDAAFYGMLKYSNDEFAQIDSSFRTPYRSEIEVVGSAGSIRVPVPYKPGISESIQLLQGDSTRVLGIEGQELYLGEVQDMEGAILEGQQPNLSLAESRGTIASIVALLESARTGKPVQVQ